MVPVFLDNKWVCLPLSDNSSYHCVSPAEHMARLCVLASGHEADSPRSAVTAGIVLSPARTQKPNKSKNHTECNTAGKIRTQ